MGIVTGPMAMYMVENPSTAFRATQSGSVAGSGGATVGAEESTTKALGTKSLTEGWRSVWDGCNDSVDRGLLMTVAPA
eukprot:CAMPEP_0194306422 /NCGR_PEP_ID=MMETSP0171-20130528/3585_1 /TAXON_ID=218684 /ORGANISM="Corethron pennatum, Strain L29A3" /LENGTH=77 /DNA_ID=CAMNT_0039058201 /DNA_START=192 /DNA_END=422 /DNA_ORIENTATION=+